MGFNTAMILRNDHLDRIHQDPDFGTKVFTATITNGQVNREQAFDVLPSVHADEIQVVAIGGNSIRRLGGYAGNYASDDEEILRNLADSMGFRLEKKED